MIPGGPGEERILRRERGEKGGQPAQHGRPHRLIGVTACDQADVETAAAATAAAAENAAEDLPPLTGPADRLERRPAGGGVGREDLLDRQLAHANTAHAPGRGRDRPAPDHRGPAPEAAGGGVIGTGNVRSCESFRTGPKARRRTRRSQATYCTRKPNARTIKAMMSRAPPPRPITRPRLTPDLDGDHADQGHRVGAPEAAAEAGLEESPEPVGHGRIAEEGGQPGAR